MSTEELFELCLWFLGVAMGVYIGWLIWCRPRLTYGLMCRRRDQCERGEDDYCARCHSEAYP